LFVACGDGGSPGTSGVVGEYTLGATPGTITSSNPDLITGLADPGGVAVSGSDLYVVDYANEVVGEYTTSGQTVNASLVSGLQQPEAVVVSGNDLFVTSATNDTIGEYTTSGTIVNPSLISELGAPVGLAVSGSDLFVDNTSTGTVGEYTTAGTTVNASLISNLTGTIDLAVSGTVASNQLAFVQQPTSTITTADISTVTVDVEDSSGNLVSSDNSTLSLAIASGPSGATLGGTTTVSAVNGVATFSNLTLSTPGTYTLTATDDIDSSSTSRTFTIYPPAEKVGLLNPSYGNNGLASHNVGFTSTNATAQDGTQSVVVGTIGSSPAESFGITRYNSDGSLDTTFGNAGVVATTFGSTDDVPSAVDVLSNGNILVAGTATTYTNGAAGGSEFAVAEYDSDGSLDTSFGSGGEALVSFSSTSTLSDDVLSSMVVGSGGTIYLGGSSDAGGTGSTEFAIAALNSAGALLSSFGGGKVLQSFGSGDDAINSLALQTNGDLVAAGSATINGTTQIALARFLPTGILDKRFGTKGLVTTNVRGVYDSASSVVIQPKGGAIIIGGISATGSGASLSSDFVLVQYTTAGRLDRSFGGAPVITSFGQPSAITQLALTASGEIIASGKTTASLASVTPDTLDVAVARYTSRGVLDTTFNGTGKTIIDLSSGVIGSTGILTNALQANTNQTTTITEQFTIQPLDASSLGAEFAAFSSSAQGVVSLTPGGEILAAGNSGSDTVEAELITAGVDLATSLLASLPAAVTGGSKAVVTITITESGNDQATGTVTIDLELADDAQGDGETTFKTVPEKINLKEKQSRSYHISFVYPSSITAGSYYLVADVNNGTSATLADLNPQNNLAASKAAVNVAPPFVSLAGTDLSTPSTFTPGKPVAATFTLTNDGNIPAKGPITVDVILSSDQTAADGTIIDPAKLVVSLPAGKSKPNRITFKLPSTITAGSYYLIAVIDPTDSIGSDDKTSSTVVDATGVVVG
jgi:uncharacterized delta-60 repeat protein